MTTIHWIGAGLSSIPGIRRLVRENHTLILWNRTLEKAEAAVAGLSGDFQVEAFTLEALESRLRSGDILVSMLPADWHVELAKMCLDKQAHFISSSYLSPEMSSLDAQARSAEVCLINEVGLDPGLDHLFAHLLVDEYTRSGAFDKQHRHFFRSYCGGFPKTPNEFRYKFSWSPLGVLNALKSPARSIHQGKIVETARPWHALSSYTAPLGNKVESFQAYPNRDSLPFMKDYQIGEDWRVDEFVRGTLRLEGWSDAWSDIFEEVEALTGEDGDRRLRTLSKQLWASYAYEAGEPDRVVLCVELEVRNSSATVWHKSYSIDACGNDKGSAMGRLVSLPVSLAVESCARNEIETGVSKAPRDPRIIKRWLTELGGLGEIFIHRDRTVSG